jgi:hypothetical protein
MIPADSQAANRQIWLFGGRSHGPCHVAGRRQWESMKPEAIKREIE